MRTMFRHVTRAHRADRFLSLLLGVGLATGTGTTGALATEQASRTDTRLLSVAEAEKRALDSNPSLLSVEAKQRANQALTNAGISRMLPSVFLSDEYQHWNQPFVIAFGPQTLQARDADTNTFSASVSQPLLGLVKLVEEYRAQKLATKATEAQIKVVQAAVRKGVRIAFLRHFEAKAMEEIAQQSEKELSEQVTIAEAKLKAGVLTHADVLRVKVAVANAQQQEIVAHTQAEVARVSILVAMGGSPDDGVQLQAPTELLLTSRGEVGAYGESLSRAWQARPELQTARLVIDARQHQERSRLWSLLPDINAEGGYVRIDGQIFAPQNSAFVGVKASWPIWTWGTSWFGYRAAQAETESARQELAAQKRQVANEVASELSQSAAARSAVRVAEQSITSAQEAYRVTDALVKAGSATTTDLLEAQSALAQARLNLVRAQYQLASAYVSIQHAIGDEK
ncbi:MAG TPA: TolC family protein [Pseudomonadota bacterium]|nr:TolC family protein [Pseudomonadota bacterium]HNK47213.1 TolC family protein [Pseudomonadota bacterium]HNN54577.1 TolC family protein [Pseudomonadota bacterium]